MDGDRRIVLLVEDNPHTRRVTRKVLERGGYEVVEVDSVLQAKTLLKGFAPDLAVVDFHLPYGTGYDVLDALRELPIHVPAVLYTGEEVSARGFDAVLLKPASPDELLRVLREVLS